VLSAAPAQAASSATSAPPRHVSLSLRLQEQVSAFPIGDLLRAQQVKHSRLWPLAAAAVLALGVTTWLLQRGPTSGAKPAAVSGHAPAAPAPAPAPVAPPARVTPTPPAAAAPIDKPKTIETSRAVAIPASKPAADGGVQTADSARLRAPSNSKRRSKSESKRTAVDTPDIPEPTSEPRREAAPPEPEPAPGKFIPEDI
jgi:hypothetical protein